MKWDRTSRARVLAAIVALMGVLNATSSVVFPMTERLRWLRGVLPREIILGSRSLSLVAGFFLIAVGWNLAQRKRIAWLLTAWLLLISILSHLLKGLDVAEAGLATLLLVMLWLARRDFNVRSDPDAVQGLLFAAPYALLFFFAYAILGFWVLRTQFRPGFDLGNALQDTINLATFQGEQFYTPVSIRARWFAESITMMAGVGIIYLGYSLMRPVLRPTPVTRRDRRAAADIIRAYGSSAVAYFCLSEDKAYYFNEEVTTVIAYTLARSVALAAGDPIGPPEDAGDAIESFRAFCDQNDWAPAFYQVREATLPLYRHAGLETLKIGEEALIDLPAFDTHGKAKDDLRAAVNRAHRECWKYFCFDRPVDDPAILSQIQSISEAWLADKFGGEMGFVMGGTPVSGSAETLVSGVTNAEGQVWAFVTWAPMFGVRGWVVDFMRRSADAPNGVMEYIIVETINRLRERGDQVASLGLAPLANAGAEGNDALLSLDKGIELIYERFNTVYRYKSLHQFKSKFVPRWENRYLAYPSLAALPRVAYALASAQMPNFGLAEIGQLVRRA